MIVQQKKKIDLSEKQLARLAASLQNETKRGYEAKHGISYESVVYVLGNGYCTPKVYNKIKSII